MNKSQLVDEIAQRTGKPARDVAIVLEALMDVVRRAVVRGEKVVLSGFGTFYRRQRAARTARDISAGAPLRLRPANVPAFRAGKPFREAMVRRPAAKKPTASRSRAKTSAVAARTPRRSKAT